MKSLIAASISTRNLIGEPDTAIHDMDRQVDRSVVVHDFTVSVTFCTVCELPPTINSNWPGSTTLCIDSSRY